MKRLLCLWLGFMLLSGCLPALATEPAPILDLATVEEVLAQQETTPTEPEASQPEENWEVLPEPERPAFVPLLLDIARGRFLFRKAVCPDWGPQWLQGADRNLMKNEYHPRSGDLLFFSYNEAGDTEHVALVEFCARHEDGQLYVHVLEGNNPDRVQRNHYELDDSQILGYGLCEDVIGTAMRFGNTGDKVLALQEKLHELGYLEERHLTGTYGSNTRAAVIRFQSEAMYEDNPNGIANLYTQRAIDELLEEKRYNSRESWLVTD